MANAIAFLASDRSNYINGREIVVDGGMESTLMNNVPELPGAGRASVDAQITWF